MLPTKKVEVEKKREYCYHTVNGRNLDLVDMEHIHTYPIFLQGFYTSKRWLVVWDFLNHQRHGG